MPTANPDENTDKPVSAEPQENERRDENKLDSEGAETENLNGSAVDAVAAQARDKKSKQQAEAEAAKTAAIPLLRARPAF